MWSDHERRFLLTRRVGHLATADSRAIPHVVPVCLTISQGTLATDVEIETARHCLGSSVQSARFVATSR